MDVIFLQKYDVNLPKMDQKTRWCDSDVRQAHIFLRLAQLNVRSDQVNLGQRHIYLGMELIYARRGEGDAWKYLITMDNVHTLASPDLQSGLMAFRI